MNQRDGVQKRTIGMNQMKKRTSRLTSQHKLEIVRRLSRVAELISEGKTTRDREEVLRSEGFRHCDHVSVVRDLKLERARLAQAALIVGFV